MVRRAGLTPSAHRLSRTLSISLLVFLVALLAGPGAAAAVPHPTALAAPSAGAVGASAPSRTAYAQSLGQDRAAAPSALAATIRSHSSYPSWLPARSTRSAAALNPSAVQAELQSASNSLSVGAGPAHGTPLTCSLSSSSQGNCVVAATAAHPAVATETWQNATSGDGTVPTEGYAGVMAYDAYDGAVIYFGGCDYTACPDNQTWAYYGYFWEDITVAGDSPPAVTFAAMDYDANLEEVLLFGGCNIYECPTNWTYAFSYEFGWLNLTNDLLSAYPFAPAPFLLGASMVFANDSDDQYTMMFGGCDFVYDTCLSLSNQTWAFDSGGWIDLGINGPQPTDYQSMVYDPAINETILFGGCTLSACDDNQTWGYYDLSWDNLTGFLGLFGPGPSGRGYAAMTYDQLDNELVLYGGDNSATVLNDTWTLTCAFIFCAWTNVTPLGQQIPALWDAAAPGISNWSMGTMLFGGEMTDGALSNGTYVFEPQLSVAPVVPSTVVARTSVDASANPSGGAGDYAQYAGDYYAYWVYGSDFSYGTNTTLNFTYPGTYAVNLTVYDWFDVPVADQFTVVATGPSTTIGGPTSTDVGHSLALTAAVATGGNAPYNYTWSFGDGSTGYGLAVTHTWGTAGTFAVVLEVNDSEGLTYNATASVVITAAPTVTAAASHTTVDAGQSVTFTPTVTPGTAPYTYSWSFGDGTAASTASAPSHTFASAGSYKVVVNVTDAAGVLATTSVTVTVNAALGGAASVSSPSVTTGTTETFTATATGGTGPYTYDWVFGDGTTATGATVTHSYSSANTYDARVWINDSVGLSSIQSVSVTVTSPSGGGHGTSGSNGGLSGTTLYIVIAVIVIVIALVAAMLMMRNRKPKSGTSTAPPSGADGSATPPPPGASAAWSESPPPPPGAGGPA
jgi:PKD repeat protein